MKELILVRCEESEGGAIGLLMIESRVFCLTLEPDDKDKVKHQIPAGRYPIKRFHGKKWQDTFEVVVPGHTAVLFHSGNTEVDTLMCVILGYRAGYLGKARAVLESDAAFHAFMTRMGDEKEGWLTVVDLTERLKEV